MTGTVHPTAIIDATARLGERVCIGPYCVVGPDVVLGDDVELKSHVVIAEKTTIGPRTRVYSFSVLGEAPQELKYRGEPTTLAIGADCLIREGVTMHRGTPGGRQTTTVGDRCSFFAYAHVAHDCIVGSNCVLANNVMLAGHVTVGDFVIIGGGAGIHQFVRVGSHAFIGAVSIVVHDVIPYGMAVGPRATLNGLNLVGLRRRGFDRDQIHLLRRAYRLIFADEGTLLERVEDVASTHPDSALVTEVLDFIRLGGDRAILTPDVTD